MKINSIADFRRAMRHGPYAWPGAYPMYFITRDGGVLSFDAARESRRAILESIAANNNDGFQVIAAEVNWEDSDLICDITGNLIEAAYP